MDPKYQLKRRFPKASEIAIEEEEVDES